MQRQSRLDALLPRLSLRWRAGSSTFQYSLAQTPGPDLACQDAVMESEVFISSENSCISTSPRTRAGGLKGLIG